MCGEDSATKLKQAYNSAFDTALSDVDTSTLEFLEFLAKLDHINDLDDKDKTAYTVGQRKVQIIDNQKQLNIAIKNIIKSKIVGFDTEQKPVFKKGETPSKMAIVQLSDQHYSYVIQVQKIQNLSPLLDVLSSPDVTKVGIGLRGDSKSLFDEYKIHLKSCIDFGALFRSKLSYPNEVGAKKSVLFFLDQRLQKTGRASRSNWENRQLTESQIKYASEDSSCVYDVFLTMLIKYPYLLEILPEWFKEKFEENHFENNLNEFKLALT